MWWVLKLSHWKEHGREDESEFFVGKDFEEKLTTYDEYEESDDEFLNEAIKKLAFFISFWYMGRATSEEEFKAVEELYSSQNEDPEEDEVEEVNEKEEAQAADKAADKAETETEAEVKTEAKVEAENSEKPKLDPNQPKPKPKVRKQKQAEKKESKTEEKTEETK